MNLIIRIRNKTVLKINKQKQVMIMTAEKHVGDNVNIQFQLCNIFNIIKEGCPIGIH